MSALQPQVTVVVPVRDGARSLGACLSALGRQVGPSREVIVVDNGSSDGTVALAQRHPAVTRVLHEPRPGSYAARNAGIAAARAEVLAFTDADVVPANDWLAHGVAVIGAGADLAGGAIMPLRTPCPGIWERYDAALYLDQEEHVVHQGFAATANLFARRAVLDAVGGFDDTLRSSGDLEWCRRAVAAGFVLAYAGDAVVAHRPRTTAAGTWRLHRRLGAGWRVLADRDEWPAGLDDPALRIPLGQVVEALAADGPPVRRRQVAHVHALAMAARVVGKLTGRG